MTTTPRSIAPTLAAAALGGATAAVLRRMEGEYVRTDTLSPSTVAAMYATYSAHTVALAWGTRRRIWPVRLPPRSSHVAGTTLAAVGGAVALAGASPFGAGKQISGIEPGDLHAAGIYRYSRNPQYLGLGLAATGVSIAARSAFTGLLAAGVWAAYRRWIPSEEHHLARIFGNEYTTYRATAARWLGTTRTNQPHRMSA